MASSLEQNTIKLFITKQKSITKLYIPIYLKMGPGAPLTKTITHTHTQNTIFFELKLSIKSKLSFFDLQLTDMICINKK